MLFKMKIIIHMKNVKEVQKYISLLIEESALLLYHIWIYK